MEFLYEYGIFLAKAVTIVIAIVAILGAITASAMKNKTHKKGELSIENLSNHFSELKHHMQAELLSKDELKAAEKADKEQKKAEQKIAKAKKKSGDEQVDDKKPKLFVVDFKGSMDAHEAENLREEITAVLAVADKEKDEVLVRLESPGGVVHGYGLAASQLARIRQRGIPLTAAVDKVAASGGYMMASVADKIVCAPFAIIGSIGVIAQIPNLHRLLKKHDVDFEQMTAGEYKRTMTVFGENTDAGRAKFKQELEETHELFKQHINEYRPELAIDKVATGEHWYGTQAIELGLIDRIQTSDDYILDEMESKEVIQVKYTEKKKLSDKLPFAAASVIDAIFVKAWQRIQSIRHV